MVFLPTHRFRDWCPLPPAATHSFATSVLDFTEHQRYRVLESHYCFLNLHLPRLHMPAPSWRSEGGWGLPAKVLVDTKHESVPSSVHVPSLGAARPGLGGGHGR